MLFDFFYITDLKMKSTMKLKSFASGGEIC